jgi:hypothetical protein
MTDNMNDFQHTELNSIKSRNQGGGGWTLSEFGHRMAGDKAVVRCVRFHAGEKMKHILEYEVDPRGVSKLVRDDKGPAI